MKFKIVLYLALVSATAWLMDGAQADPPPPAKAATAPAFHDYDSYPPIADADPSVVHDETMDMPTALEIKRTWDTLSVTDIALKPVKVSVGLHMLVGVMSEAKAYRDGDPVPDSGFLSLGGDGHMGTHIYNRYGPDKLPQPDVPYDVEISYSIFETDVPPQHMWSPKGGKYYKVLWTKTLKELVK